MFKCDQCDREFNTQQGLDQHRADKHSASSHEKREQKKQAHHEIQKTVESKAKRKKTGRKILILIAFLAVMGVIAWAIASYKPSSQAYNPSNLGDNVMGSPNASVVIVEYSDFQCPFCARFYRDTEGQIKSNYIDTGKVRFVYKHFPLNSIHSYAQKAAEASECAAEQGKFWEYHDKLFDNQKSLFTNSLKQYAVDIGLNATQFNSCLDSSAMQQKVSNDYQQGIAAGVKSTPTFFINGQRIEGAQPYSVFEAAIEKELK